MGLLDQAMSRLEETIANRVSAVEPFRAIVTGTSGGMVTIRRLEAATGETELRARVAGVDVVADDEVLCVNVSGKPVVVGRLNRTDIAGIAAPSHRILKAAYVFQSPPNPKAGCNLALPTCYEGLVGEFQSPPNPKAGCNQTWDRNGRLIHEVSIPTQPESRVQLRKLR